MNAPTRPLTTYVHHDTEVVVDPKYRGKHRKFCLCFKCANFHPEDREKNCPVANELYALDVKYGLTTPVWECPSERFRPKE